MTKAGFVSLGCHKALLHSGRILTLLRGDSYDLVPGYADAAEIDGNAHVASKGAVCPGDMIRVPVDAADAYGLQAS